MGSSIKSIAIALMLFFGGMHTQSEASEISAEGDGEVGFITIQGQIFAGDKDKLEVYLERYKKGFIILQGPGGDLLEALNIGEKIAEGNYITIVSNEGRCMSACALIWLGGKNRMIEPGGKVGFHSAYTKQEGRQVATGFGNAMIGRYLAKLSLSPKATYFITSAPPHSMYWLDTNEPGSEGITYAYVSLDEIFDNVSGKKNPERAEAPANPPPSRAINPDEHRAVKSRPRQ